MYHKDTSMLRDTCASLIEKIKLLITVNQEAISSAETLRKAMIHYQNENERLRALLEEHCQGCPVSELK